MAKAVSAGLAAHVSTYAKAKALFQRAEAQLEAVMQGKPPIGKPITIGKKTFVIVDQFKKKNVAFKASRFARYKVEEFKAGK